MMAEGQRGPDVSPTKGFFDKRMTRRGFVGGAAAAGAALATGGFNGLVIGGPNTAQAEAAAPAPSPDILGIQSFKDATPEEVARLMEFLSGDAGFGLPVSENVEDIRKKKIKDHRIRVDPSLMINPPGELIKSVDLNPDMHGKGFEERPQNRWGVLGANALLRVLDMSERYIDDESGLMALYATRELPPTPDWGKRILQMQNGQELTYEIEALEVGAEATWENVHRMKGIVQEGFIVNVVNPVTHPGLIHHLEGSDGVSIRMTPEGAMMVDVAFDNTSFDWHKDSAMHQMGYDRRLGAVILTGLTSAIMTLGKYGTSADGYKSSLYNRGVIHNYGDKFTALGEAGLFPDQFALMFGGTLQDAINNQFADRLPRVNFPGNDNPLASA